MQSAMYIMIQSCALGDALLKIKVKVLDSIYSAEKEIEEPIKIGVDEGIFDRKKKYMLKRLD